MERFETTTEKVLRLPQKSRVQAFRLMRADAHQFDSELFLLYKFPQSFLKRILIVADGYCIRSVLPDSRPIAKLRISRDRFVHEPALPQHLHPLFERMSRFLFFKSFDDAVLCDRDDKPVAELFGFVKKK